MSTRNFKVNLKERRSQQDALSSRGTTPLFNTTSRVKIEHTGSGCGLHDGTINDANNNVRTTRIKGTIGETDHHNCTTGVQVKSGSEGKSVIQVGDEHFGLSINCDLANTNVIVNTDGEQQVITQLEDGGVNVEKSKTDNRELFKPKQESEEFDEGSHKETVTTTSTDNGDEIKETKTVERKDKGGIHTEKKTTVTERKTPGGTQTRRTFESKTAVGKGVTPTSTSKIQPKSGSAASRQTNAQRRAAQNKTPSVKNNPFKAQAATQKPTVGQATNFKLPGKAPASTTGAVDAATGNIEKLLKWIQKRVNQYPAVEVKNFTNSWEDGIAMCALMNYLLGDEAVDPTKVSPTDKLNNFKLALTAATDAGVPALLVAEELARGEIDRRSMITYLHLVYTKLFADKKAEKDAEN